MGSSPQLYHLGWSDYDSSLKRAVKGLRSRGDLVDVTLAAEGKTFPAHKLVLSASSTLFLELLKVTPCQHPVILLAGISASDLEYLLDFVYSGEVSVHPSQLSSLLQAAHVLNIRGLADGSITAEKPEEQKAAEAALASSAEASQKLNFASLAAATRSSLIATVNSGAGSFRRKKSKWKDSDSSDVPQDKWGRYESEDESSETECTATELTTSQPLTNQTAKANNSNATESAAKPNKQSGGSVNATPHKSIPGKSTTVKADQPSGNQTSNMSEVSRSGSSSDVRESALAAHHHHLLMSEDEENKDESSYGAIAAAADAAALVASTLADKKGISDQPAACPLCNAIIRQSRNLRRHLELKHFGRKPKKGKGSKRRSHHECDTDSESNAGSVADTTVIEHVQVEMKSPSVCDVVLSSVPPSSASTPNNSPPPKHHTLTELQPAPLHGNVETYLQQQQQQLQQLQMESFPHHMAPPPSNSTYQIPYPHPHPHLSMLRGDPHASLLASDSLAFRAASHQFSAAYNESSRSSNQH